MKVFYLLVSALSVWTPTHAQFFYSHYSPLPQISPIFQQPFLQPLPAVSHLAYTAPPPQAVPAPSSVTYNIPAASTPEFRGFGYRTDYKDGASSTVFYVTGPEAETLRNFRDFPSFTRKVDENAGRARSLASDITDINAIPDAQGKIQSILQPAEFQRLFDNMPGVVNFYNFPAGTAPLPLARQLNVTAGDSAANVTTTTPAAEEEAAESVINPKVIVNTVDNTTKSNNTTETTTVSETPQVSSTSSTTEDTSTETSENKEEQTATSSNEEATTVEATTSK